MGYHMERIPSASDAARGKGRSTFSAFRIIDATSISPVFLKVVSISITRLSALFKVSNTPSYRIKLANDYAPTLVQSCGPCGQIWGHAAITSQKSRPSPTKSTADSPDIVLGHAESEKHILLTHSFLDTQAASALSPSPRRWLG
jgi:hypothetical protein